MKVTNIDSQALNEEKKSALHKSLSEKHSGLCPVRDILGHFGDKWSIFTILSLGQRESVRFNELKGMVTGVSQRMLTVTLRSLEENGVVDRTWYPEIPPRVEYRLTPLGRSLLEKMVELWAWASTHMDDVQAARRKFARRRVKSVRAIR